MEPKPKTSRRILPLSLLLTLAVGVASLFLIAAFSKFFHFEGICSSIRRLGWLPEILVIPAAVGLITAELTTGLLLLAGRLKQGAALGLLLSGVFTFASLTSILRGDLRSCSCLGELLKISPTTMVWIDLSLIASCAVLLWKQESILYRSGENSTEMSAWIRKPISIGAVIYVILFTTAVQAGVYRQRLLEGRAANEKVIFTLHYGQTATDFRLPTSEGDIISLADMKGKWTLLSFVELGCAPCDSDLQSLSHWHDHFPSRKNVNFLTVVIGRNPFQSATATAKRVKATFALNFPVACDATGVVAKEYCDKPIATPFHVLLDGDGQVRLVQSGRDTDSFERDSTFFVRLEDYLTHRNSNYGGVVSASKPAINGNVLISQKFTSLSDLWRDKTVLLNFVSTDCDSCLNRINHIERIIGHNKRIVVVNAVENKGSLQLAVNKFGAYSCLMALDTNGSLFKSYSIKTVPSSFLISQGRQIASRGGDIDENEFERLLESVVAGGLQFDQQ